MGLPYKEVSLDVQLSGILLKDFQVLRGVRLANLEF
jgi:hypothetical protein